MKLFRLASAWAVTALCSGCSGASPAAPTPTPTPQPAAVTITGHVLATNGTQPLGGVTASLGPTTTATTDGSGGFQLSVPGPFAAVRLLLESPAILSRSVLVGASTSREVTLDAIALGSGFDLTFYRQFVRNTLDAPTGSEPLRRWTVAPQFYLKTVDEGGAAVNAATLDSTERAIREAVPVWTAGQFQASVTRGTETRAGVSGWVTVRWQTDRPAGSCGRSDIGLSGGVIDLFPNNPCKCGSTTVAVYPKLVRHETGHAMGFWHTDSAADLMFGGVGTTCDAQPSARERYHAAIAYSRPVGNTDPDVDGAGAVNLAPRRAMS
jgi:hypothetical protein